MVDVPNCNIIEIKLELQVRYDLHFRTNALGLGMKYLIPQLQVK